MIDIESIVFHTVSQALRQEGCATVYGEYVDTPSEFPSAAIVETNNFQSVGYIQVGNLKETVSDVTYTINIYSNLIRDKKSEVKRLMEVADREMERLGFTRTMCQQMPHVDRTIYRMTSRYVGRVVKYEDGRVAIFGR